MKHIRIAFLWMALALLAASLLYGCSGESCGLTAGSQLYDSLYSHERDTARLLAVRDSLLSVGNPAELIHVDKQLGRLMRNNSLFLRALEYHQEGLRLAEEARDTVEAVRALNNIATDFRRMGSLDDAAAGHYAALQLCDRYADTLSFHARKNRVTSLNGLGNVYLSLGDLELADSLFRQALYTEHALGSHLGQAINWANLGAIHEQRGNRDSARVYYQRSMQENELEGSQLGISLCHLYFGQLHEADRQWNEALDEYRQAYNLMAGGTDQWHWLQAAVAMGKVYLQKNDHPQAQHYLDTAWQVATAIRSLEHQAEIANLRYRLYDSEGDSRRALDYLRESAALHDSVMNVERVLHTQHERQRYLDHRRHREMQNMQVQFEAERQIMRITRLALSLALLLALTLVGFLFFYIRQRALRQRALVAHYERQLHGLHLLLPPAAEAGAPLPVEDVFPESSAVPHESPEQAEFMLRFNQLIMQHLAEPALSSSFLAEKMCVSPRQLSRKVKGYTGLDAMTCIRTSRINAARKMLRETNAPVLDIAMRCGFDSQAYFARVFKSVTGQTPSEYRKSNL